MSAVTKLTGINIALLVGSVVIYTAGVFYQGTKVGSAKATKALTTFVTEQQALTIKVQQEKADVEKLLAEANSSYGLSLLELRKEHEKNIAIVNDAHSSRLQQLETRELRYRQLSEATDAERRALADIATELDRTLTEGRQLVEELRREVALRNQQLITIGEQVLGERKERSQGSN